MADGCRSTAPICRARRPTTPESSSSESSPRSTAGASRSSARVGESVSGVPPTSLADGHDVLARESFAIAADPVASAELARDADDARRRRAPTNGPHRSTSTRSAGTSIEIVALGRSVPHLAPRCSRSRRRAGQDVALELLEGAMLVREAAARAGQPLEPAAPTGADWLLDRADRAQPTRHRSRDRRRGRARRATSPR